MQSRHRVPYPVITKIISLRKRGLGYTEIAKQMGMTKNKIAGILYRSRQGIYDAQEISGSQELQ